MTTRTGILAAAIAALLAACGGMDTGGDAGPPPVCHYCGTEFANVVHVRCGDAGAALTQCDFCCRSTDLAAACMAPCTAGDCTTACSSLDADPTRHDQCATSCMRGSCSVACGYASVDLHCVDACNAFLACTPAGTSCSAANACLATACASGG